MRERDLTVQELADLLQMSPRWVRQQVAARAIPHHRRGRLVRFTPADVAAIREDMGAQPVEQPPNVVDLALRRLRSSTPPGTPPPSNPPQTPRPPKPAQPPRAQLRRSS